MGLTCEVRLTGDYLRGNVVQVHLDDKGRIVACSQLWSVWTGTPRFHDWFVDLYAPVLVNPLTGQASFRFVQISAPEEIRAKLAA